MHAIEHERARTRTRPNRAPEGELVPCVYALEEKDKHLVLEEEYLRPGGYISREG